MIYKWVGACLIVSCCAGCGLSVSNQQKAEMKMLSELRRFLDNILCELPYKLTPLPDLIRSASSDVSGKLKRLLEAFAGQLDRQCLPDVSCCMTTVLNGIEVDSVRISRLLVLLGNSLGRFDLAGQLRELTGIQEQCKAVLCEMQAEHDLRFRSYRVLAISAGIALTILLI